MLWGAGEERTAESGRSKGGLRGPSRPVSCHPTGEHPGIGNTLENGLSFPTLAPDGNSSHSPTASPGISPSLQSRWSSFCPTGQLRCWLIPHSLFEGWTVGQPDSDDSLILSWVISCETHPGASAGDWGSWELPSRAVLRLNMTSARPAQHLAHRRGRKWRLLLVSLHL